jgi:ribosomal-protein-alanine acetyltransferase
MQIERSSFPTPWSLENIEKLSRDSRSLFLVARNGNALLGFVLSWITLDKIHILKFAVDINFRRKGIGRALLAATCDKAVTRNARIIWLEVREQNSEALNFYTNMEFRTVARRKGYYGDTGEDALLMAKIIFPDCV